MKPLKYTLQILRDGQAIHPASKEIRGKEIPVTVTGLVHSGDRYTYTVRLWRNNDEHPIVELYRIDCGYQLKTHAFETLPKEISTTLEWAQVRLNSDILYQYRAEVQRLFETMSELFVLKYRGSDYGYVKTGETPIDVLKLSYGLVVKTSERWTNRYKFVYTYVPRSYLALISACQHMREEAAEYGRETPDGPPPLEG